MIVENFKGYIEGADLTKIPVENLAYPSKNLLVQKGKIYKRDGIVNDGTAPTNTSAVHSEFVWKDAIGGERPIRVWGQTVQVKYDDRWLTIYTALDADTLRVFFATWVDNNGAIVKKRLFFVDGSTAVYQWNGAIGSVVSATANSAVMGGDTLPEQGFDDGSTTNQTIMHFIGTATTANSEEIQTNNPTAQTLSISGTFNTTPVAGDLIITKPVKFANAIASTFDIDEIYSYVNHIVIANYGSVNVYFSHISTYSLATGLDFTQPAAGSRTALTAIFMRLDGNFTAMIARKNVLWISDANDWYKVTKSVEVNAYGLWVDVEKLETGALKGAIYGAVAIHKGDIIYLAQDSSLNRITTLEVLGTDDVRLMSDDISALLLRLDLDDVRLNFIDRAIYIICPAESTTIIYDVVEGFFQPPQTIPMNCMSVIDGIKYGHHNASNETFILFSGKNDLNTPIEAIYAPGYTHGENDLRHPLRLKQHTMIGFSIRISTETKVSVEQQFEEDGARTDTTFDIDGGTIKTFSVSDDVSWATHPYADRSWAGGDEDTPTLLRAFAYKKFDAVSYFDFRPVLTIARNSDDADGSEFQLLAWYIDDSFAQRKVANELFIPS